MDKKINLSQIIEMEKKCKDLQYRVDLHLCDHQKNLEELEQLKLRLASKVEKIEGAIRTAEKRARVRKITVNDIFYAVHKAQNAWHLPKRLRTDIKIDVDIHAQNFAGAYKWIPVSTHFTAVCHNGQWYLTDVYRAKCRRRGHRILAQIPEATLDYIAKRARVEAQDIA